MNRLKKEARAEALARRDAVPLGDRAARSAAICEELECVLSSGLAEGAGCAHAAEAEDAGCEGNGAGDVHGGPIVAVYAAMKSEVSLEAFVDAATRRGWRLCYPCMMREEGEAGPKSEPESGPGSRMRFFCLPEEPCRAGAGGQGTGAADAGTPGSFLAAPLRACDPNGPELAGCTPIEPCAIDAVVVPLVAFDDEGRRLGYGGGNYDRLLPLLRSDALVVGVAFEEQRCEAVPCEPHDRPLLRIVAG